MEAVPIAVVLGVIILIAFCLIVGCVLVSLSAPFVLVAVLGAVLIVFVFYVVVVWVINAVGEFVFDRLDGIPL